MATSVDVNPRLKASFRNEPKKMLPPISRYEDEPLLPLEEACKPLERIIDNELQQNITIAKLNSSDPEDGLTQEESASIYLYTMEWKVPENSLYAVLNRTLCMVDRRKLQPWFRYLKLFLTAFFKLPPTEHRTVWRDFAEDLSSLYPKGREFTWWGISSCTSSISVLESSQYAGTSGTRTMFSIETNNGKLIRSHSCFQQEDEILLPSGIYLQVIDKCSSTDGLNIIYLREIPPPYAMLADALDLSQLKQGLPQSNPAEQPPSEENESQPTTPQKKSAYCDKMLDCGGHACATCHHCRDWYWRPDGDTKVYTKRFAHATCCCGCYFYNDNGYNNRNNGSYFYNDRNYGDGRGYWHNDYNDYNDYCDYRYGFRGRLCECENNRA